MALASAGCAGAGDGLGYYWQSASGHIALMRSARPIADVLADPATDPLVRDKLHYARIAREFAVTSLGLPDNGSYRAYAELKRPHVLWNVFATPELSMELKQWCFPVAGCVGYRGYYDPKEAQRYADGLAASGFDVRVGGVPAYSTLGWFDDPLPSPVVAYPAPEIARLIFHELAHQVVYVKGDSTFNESFATTVERIGMARWLRQHEVAAGDTQAREQYEQQQARKQDFVDLLLQTRRELEEVYRGPGTDDVRRAAKALAFEALKARYRRLRDERWAGYSGYDRWFEQPLGNAHLAAVAAYNDRVPAFEGLLVAVEGDLGRFYGKVRELAELTPNARKARLDDLLAEPVQQSARSPAAGLNAN